MKKKDLYIKIAKECGITQNISKGITDSIFYNIEKLIIAKKSVPLSGFGTFSIILRKARVGTNPKTGKKINIPKKWTPKFKVSKTLKQIINH